MEEMDELSTKEINDLARKMISMGFTNEDENRRALEKHGGNFLQWSRRCIECIGDCREFYCLTLVVSHLAQLTTYILQPSPNHLIKSTQRSIPLTLSMSAPSPIKTQFQRKYDALVAKIAKISPNGGVGKEQTRLEQEEPIDQRDTAEISEATWPFQQHQNLWRDGSNHTSGLPAFNIATPPSPHHFRSSELDERFGGTDSPKQQRVPLLLSSMTPVHVLEALLGELEEDGTPPATMSPHQNRQSLSSSFSSTGSTHGNSPSSRTSTRRASPSPSHRISRKRRSSTASKSTKSPSQRMSRAHYMTQHLTSSLNMHAFYKFVLSQQKSYFDAMELLRESDERLEYVLKRHHEHRSEQKQMEQETIRLRQVIRNMKDEEEQRKANEEQQRVKSVTTEARSPIQQRKSSTTHASPLQSSPSSTNSPIKIDENTITDPHLKQAFLDQQRTIKRLTRQLEAATDMISVYKSLELEIVHREDDFERLEQKDKDQVGMIQKLSQQLETTILIIQEQENRIESAESLLNRISEEDSEVVLRVMQQANGNGSARREGAIPPEQDAEHATA